MRNRRKFVVVGVVALVVVVALPLLLFESRGVGSTDLEMIFDVRDAETRRAIPGATIEVLPEGVPPGASEHVKIVTGQDGRAHRLCEHMMSYIVKGFWRSSYNVQDPSWHFRVAAPGYTKSDWLETGDFPRCDQFIDGGHSRRTIGVSLRKAPNVL